MPLPDREQAATFINLQMIAIGKPLEEIMRLGCSGRSLDLCAPLALAAAVMGMNRDRLARRSRGRLRATFMAGPRRDLIE